MSLYEFGNSFVTSLVIMASFSLGIFNPSNTAQTPPAKARGHSHARTAAAVPDVAAEPERIIPDVNVLVPQNGMVPAITSIKTTKPVVFLTIDDGMIKDPAVMNFMEEHHLLASLFLNDSAIANDYQFFQTLQAQGNRIENHTVNHPDLTKLSYLQQKHEICDNADTFAAVFGKRPTLFRPPFGAYNDATRRAAADCGMTALVSWHAKVNNGSAQYQQGDKLQAGDIVLMHFRKEVITDVTAYYKATKKAGLTTVLLENWVN